ncbi:MAG: hypothetical protein Q9227_006379 [Pyrenula ochraceoflavens]
MAFFLTLAYIAISIDASGLIRYLAFKVLQEAGDVGHRLFFYLYAFFFGLGSFIGNDPIILSGTAFLAYMTRVSSNITHPRAWIFTQFAVANTASAILVSSNPTNLVLAGAFNIKFIHYTANMIVPVVVTAIVMFPILLYFVFADESLIPFSIKMHELSEEAKAKKPVNPNIPNARGTAQEEENNHLNDEQGKVLSLEEIMNPFLDKGGATFGAVIMAATLITILALNAASQSSHERPVFWVTLPAAFVMFCWDVGFGWYHREETREIARKGRQEVEFARAERENMESKPRQADFEREGPVLRSTSTEVSTQNAHEPKRHGTGELAQDQRLNPEDADDKIMPVTDSSSSVSGSVEKRQLDLTLEEAISTSSSGEIEKAELAKEKGNKEVREVRKFTIIPHNQRPTLVSLVKDGYRWLQETFPTVTAVLAHLPFALVPFAFSMFVLVQALVTKGWVPVFAHGWDHWVNKTGTIGSIGGMGFLSVILCNGLLYRARPAVKDMWVVKNQLLINNDAGNLHTERKDLSCVQQFHRNFPGYKPSPLVPLPELAKECHVKAVFIKDESDRFGLPSFKALGASWGVFKAVASALSLPVTDSIDRLAAAAREGGIELFAATDGNHGRAVAYMARLLTIAVYIYVPCTLDQDTRKILRTEGATVLTSTNYDNAVKDAASAAAGSARGIFVQDTSFLEYQEIPNLIVDGYSTMLSELDSQLRDTGHKCNLVICPVGVGSLAQAVTQHYKALNHASNYCRVMTVEPETAACLWESLKAGKSISLKTSATVMTGMDCGTVSYNAWPVLLAGVDGSLIISDLEADKAVQYLDSMGVSSGPCGSSGVAALRKLAAEYSADVALNGDSVVVLLNTEGKRHYQISWQTCL